MEKYDLSLKEKWGKHVNKVNINHRKPMGFVVLFCFVFCLQRLSPRLSIIGPDVAQCWLRRCSLVKLYFFLLSAGLGFCGEGNYRLLNILKTKYLMLNITLKCIGSQ